MKKFVVIGIVVVALVITAPAMAFDKGTVRLGTGTGLFSSGSGFSSTTIDPDNGSSVDFDVLAFSLGYFLTEVVELDFAYSTVSIEDLDIDGIGISGRYHFPMGKNSLYVGGGFQTLDIEDGDGDAIFVTGGYNWMLRNYFSIDIYLNLGQGDIEGEDFDMTDLGITYSIYF